MSHITTGQLARRLGIQPKVLSDWFYFQGSKFADDAPVVSGRRLIPESIIPAVEIELRRAGKLPRREVARVS